jgi:hypothetical protein
VGGRLGLSIFTINSILYRDGTVAIEQINKERRREGEKVGQQQKHQRTTTTTTICLYYFFYLKTIVLQQPR